MEFISFVVWIATLAAGWFIFKKMGLKGWEAIIPFYNLYVLFRELYGNGWKFLLLLVPFYNIYLYFKLCIDMAHAFNQETGFGIGLALVTPVFECILGFGDNYIYLDGSRTNNEADVLTNAIDAVETKSVEIYENAKEKYEDAGGAEGIANDIKEKAGNVARDTKEKFQRGVNLKDDSADAIAKIKQLAELKEAGILTEEEFAAKKEELLRKVQ